MASSGFVWIPFILQAGAVVMLFFVILAGVTYHPPLNQTFFLSADVSSFHTNLDSPTGYGQWTLWSICGATANGENVNCGPMKPAYPFDPARNFGSANVPQTFVDNSSYFYYTTRFMFAFFLIALALAVFSTFMGLLALCSRLGSAITAMFCCGAFVIDLIAASLMTAAYVAGRNDFTDAGITASLGVKAFSFAWASVAALLLATFGFCAATRGRGRRKVRDRQYVTQGTRTGRFWRGRNRAAVDVPPAT